MRTSPQRKETSMAPFSERLGEFIHAEIEERILGKCDCEDRYVDKGFEDPRCLYHLHPDVGKSIAEELISAGEVADPERVPEGTVSTTEDESGPRTYVDLRFKGMPMVRGFILRPADTATKGERHGDRE